MRGVRKMREMWVDPKFYDKISFGCFQHKNSADDDAMPVVVLTREEWDHLSKLVGDIHSKIVKKEKEGNDGEKYPSGKDGATENQ
jgi:hypothetical protein